VTGPRPRQPSAVSCARTCWAPSIARWNSARAWCARARTYPPCAVAVVSEASASGSAQGRAVGDRPRRRGPGPAVPCGSRRGGAFQIEVGGHSRRWGGVRRPYGSWRRPRVPACRRSGGTCCPGPRGAFQDHGRARARVSALPRQLGRRPRQRLLLAHGGNASTAGSTIAPAAAGVRVRAAIRGCGGSGGSRPWPGCRNASCRTSGARNGRSGRCTGRCNGAPHTP
jgi:hypothetical protein